MVKIRIVAGVSALALGLSLAGCAGTTAVTPTVSVTFSQVVQDAILACQGLCGVAPTLETITSIAIAAAGGVAAAASEAVAQQAATAFCNGIVAKQSLVAGKLATPHLRRAAVPVGGGVLDYGTITVNGKVIALKGTPQS